MIDGYVMDLLSALAPYGLAGAGMAFIVQVIKKIGFRNSIWKELGIHNALKEFPWRIAKKKNELKTYYIFGLPDGIDASKFLEGGHWNHMLKQSFGDMKHTEVSLLDGHRLAVVVYHKPLPERVDYEYAAGKPLSIPIGVTLRGPVTLELGDADPHVLIGGASGKGKSTILRLVISWLCLNNVRLYLTDLKGGIEQQMFKNCRSVISCDRTVDEGLATLRVLKAEMERRLEQLYDAGKTHFSQIGLPPLVLAIDELADYEDTGEAMDLLTELGRKGRAAGVFTIAATQRPDSKVMKSSYKANMTTVLCFKTRDHYNSQVILGHPGAEMLTTPGRCLFLSSAGEQEVQTYLLTDTAAGELLAKVRVSKREKAMSTSGVL